MKNMTIAFIVLFSVVGGVTARATASAFVADGKTVVSPGIFTTGCVYGENASLSDHAPVIYETQKIATWNIGNRVSHMPIHKPWGTFLSHKFKTNADYSLIDDHGEPALLGYKSELAEIDHGKEVLNKYFGSRLRNVAKKIKEMFRSHDVEYFAIQEIPNRLKTDVDGKNLHQMMAEILSPELTIYYPQRPPVRTDWPPDVALITKANVRVEMKHVDATNRFQPYCIRSTGTCIVAAHFAYPKTEEQLVSHCMAMNNAVKVLYAEGAADVMFTGDFNTSPEDIERVCGAMGIRPIIHHADGNPQSCRDNDGNHSEHHIDLLLQFKK